MTIQKALQLEEVNNELATVLLGLVARAIAVREHLQECSHKHVRAVALLTTFQAEELLQKVSPVFTERIAVQSIQSLADIEGSAAYVAARLQGTPPCTNPSCVDGLAPRKTGPDDFDVDMEPCPVCGAPVKERKVDG